MTFDDLEIGCSVELEVSMRGSKVTLISTIEHKLGNKVLLTPLELNNKPIGFNSECIVSFHVIINSKVYKWGHVEPKIVKYNGKVYHSIEIIGDAEVLNRRGAYRVYVGERMQVTYFTSSGPKKIKVLIKDISESGFAFITKEEFTVGRTVRLGLTYGDRTLSLTAQIIRVQEDKENGVSTFGCKFVEKYKQLPSILMRLQQEHQRMKNGR